MAAGTADSHLVSRCNDNRMKGQRLRGLREQHTRLLVSEYAPSTTDGREERTMGLHSSWQTAQPGPHLGTAVLKVIQVSGASTQGHRG